MAPPEKITPMRVNARVKPPEKARLLRKIFPRDWPEESCCAELPDIKDR
jgi:hypothetical protein